MRIFVALLLVVAASCGKHLYSRNDLDVDASRYHIDLRWGRVQEAASRVHPDLRAAFLEDWARQSASYEIQDIQIVGAAPGKDDDSYDIVVSVTYVERASMNVATTTFTEKWQRTDDGWRVTRPIELTTPTR